MRWFLDMNIPIYFSFEIGDDLENKTRRFIENKNDSLFLVCEYIKKQNLPKWMKRYEVLLLEFNRIVSNQEKSVDTSILIKNDKFLLDKFLLMYKRSEDKIKFVSWINTIFSNLKIRIKLFFEKYVDEIVIPMSEIDFKLKSCLFTWLNPNDSDARTIASAIQEHQNKKLVIITADKKDWSKELLEEVHNNIDLKKEYPSLPKIEYLQNLQI